MTNQPIPTLFRKLKIALRRQFDLSDDPANEAEVILEIRKGILLSGTNIWVLICAIFICSIGLNINSTSVVIGAMLISPLMSPIMAIGLGASTNDFPLIGDSAKRLLIAALAGVVTSTLYFAISPLEEARSELLARTAPTIYDVLIAFTGGIAGMIAFTRKTRSSNVIAGFAISTALMPPLCTAGFGLAHLNFYYFFGASYLFLINCVYICLATYLVVQVLGFKKRHANDEAVNNRTSRIISVVAVVALLPSIFIAYRLVHQNRIESRIRAFVQEEFSRYDIQILKQSFQMENGKYKLRLLVLGKNRDPNLVQDIKKQLVRAGMEDVELVLDDATLEVKLPDVAELRSGILEEIVHKTERDISTRDKQIIALEQEITELRGERIDNGQLLRELQVEHPEVSRLVLVVTQVGEEKKKELLGYLETRSVMEEKESVKVNTWLQIRTKTDTSRIRIIGPETELEKTGDAPKAKAMINRQQQEFSRSL